MGRWQGISLVLALSFFLGGCGPALEWLKKIAKLDNDDLVYEQPPGEEASPFLAKTIRDSDTNVAAAMAALSVGIDQAGGTGAGLGLLADDGSVAQGDAASLKYLLATQAAKDAFHDGDFARDPADAVAKGPDALGLGEPLDAMALADNAVNWTSPKDEFTVSPLAKMPIRDQGRRGTCASFSGIGQIEGFIIKNYGVTSLDLSEQRFYYLSKPENWSNGGGDPNLGGSNTGTGFAKSAGYKYGTAPYNTDAPDTPSDYNLPLETDCPYNPKLGANDVQSPQVPGCLNNGVARVTDYAAWLYNWDNQLKTPQEIYDFLLNNDYPVTVSTKLSENWETNDGLITLRDAGEAGESSHASGHAYLIVGARKLDEGKYPGEGGMCFIIKNSWGAGWGVNGLSCMSLAWFNQWRFPNAFPQVLDVEVDTAKVEGAKRALDTRPSNLNGPGDKKGNAPQQAGRKKRGTVSFFTVTGQGLNLANDDFDYGTLRTTTGDFARMFFLVNENTMTVRAILKEKNGDADVSHDLVLSYRPPEVFAEFPNQGELAVGTFDANAKILQLCAGDYAQTCLLHYYAETNELVVGLTKARFYQEDAQGPFDWTSFAFGGYGLDVSKPEGSSSRLDVRMESAGKKTNPLRFKVDPFGGDVKYSGQTVGNYQKLSFCNGEKKYRDTCRMVIGEGDFGVIFKAKK